MVSARKVFLVMTFVLWRLFQRSCGNTSCFLFKEGGDIIRGRSALYQTLVFSVASSACFPPKGTRVDAVTIANSTGGEDQVYCQFVLSQDEACSSHRSQDCQCLSKSREFSVHLRTNSGGRCQTWKLLVGFQGTRQRLSRNVKLLIKNSSLYPAEVKRVTLQNYALPSPSHRQHLLVLPNSKVTVSCYWEEGNPPKTARLFRGNGSETLNSEEQISPSDGCLRHLHHVIEQVQCKDMGKIGCQVPGATIDMFQVLLVKCAPRFTQAGMTFSAPSSGGQLTLQFPVRVHERNITSCVLVRRSSGTNGSATPQTSSVAGSSEKTASRSVQCHQPKLVGTDLPDLILRTGMTSETSSTVEAWTVELTNSAGTGSVDFFVEIADKTEKPNRLPLAAAAIGCTAFCVLIAVIICIVQCARKGCTQNATYYQQPLDAMPASCERPPQPYPRKLSEERLDAAAGVYTSCPPSSVGPDMADCDSCLIDRIYNEIKTHATHNP